MFPHLGYLRVCGTLTAGLAGMGLPHRRYLDHTSDAELSRTGSQQVTLGCSRRL
jgi:hypothetical protein